MVVVVCLQYNCNRDAKDVPHSQALSPLLRIGHLRRVSATSLASETQDRQCAVRPCLVGTKEPLVCLTSGAVIGTEETSMLPWVN